MLSVCFGRAPEPFKGEAANFLVWLSEFEDYLSVVEILKTLTNEQKLALLRNSVGPKTCKIIDGLTLPSVSYKTVTAALKVLLCTCT